MKRILILGLILSLWSCNELDGTSATTTTETANVTTATDTAAITEIDTSSVSSSSSLEDYDQAGFSPYIYFHKTESQILLDYDFFPEGFDSDSQAKTLSIPCEYETTSDNDLLSTGTSQAETEEASCEDIVLDLSAATFTLDGIRLDFDTSLDIFVDHFEFKITRDGFVDSETGETLEFSNSDVTMEDVVDEIMGR